MNDVLGTVGTLRRHPVKSMLGEEIETAEITAQGLAGDRRLAVLDRETGKIASAKTPRLWRALLTCHATYDEGRVSITTPDGDERNAKDPEIDEVLSSLLNRDITLIDTPPEGATLDRSIPELVLEHGLEAEVGSEIVHLGGAAEPGAFLDFAAVHIITTSTLDQLRQPALRYRPNLVIRTSKPGFVENGWRERELRIGPDLVVRVIAATPRCAVPTLAHGDLRRDPDALRIAAKHNRIPAMPGWSPEPCAGVYAEVVHPGRVDTGAAVTLV